MTKKKTSDIAFSFIGVQLVRKLESQYKGMSKADKLFWKKKELGKLRSMIKITQLKLEITEAWFKKQGV